VPAPVDPPLKRHVWNWAGLLRKPQELPKLEEIGRPFPKHIKEMPKGLTEEEYVLAFLRAFDPQADIDSEIRYRDVAGNDIVISKRLFQDAQGRWKVLKRERWRYILFMAEALKDPDEVWLSIDPQALRAMPEDVAVAGKAIIDRRYIRYDPTVGILIVFEWNWRQWVGETAFAPQRTKKRKASPKQLDRRRQGELLYRRK